MVMNLMGTIDRIMLAGQCAGLFEVAEQQVDRYQNRVLAIEDSGKEGIKREEYDRNKRRLKDWEDRLQQAEKRYSPVFQDNPNQSLMREEAPCQPNTRQV